MTFTDTIGNGRDYESRSRTDHMHGCEYTTGAFTLLYVILALFIAVSQWDAPQARGRSSSDFVGGR